MKENISTKQFYAITVVYIIANDIIRGIYNKDLMSDVWLANLIGIIISILLFTLFMFIYKNNDYDNFDNSIKHSIGKFLSRIAYLFYIIYFIIIAFYNILDIIMAIIANIIPNYSTLALAFILISILYYLLFKGIEVIARLSQILVVFIILIFTLMVIFMTSLYHFDLSNVLPILYDGLSSIARPALEMGYAVPFGELFVLLIVFQHVNKKKGGTKSGLLAIITAGLILLIITLINLFVLGPFAISHSLSPAFRLTRTIDIEEYIQRMDLLLIPFHMILILVKSFILLYGASYLLKSTISLKDKYYKYLYIVLPIVLLIIFYFYSENYTEVLVFRRDFFIKYIGLIAEVFIPLLIVIMSFIRKSKRKIKPDELLEFDI